jgi:hypothetical protein
MKKLISALALTLAFGVELHAQAAPRAKFSNPYSTCHGTTIGMAMSSAGLTLSVVHDIDPMSPEGLAGLQKGDTIVTMNGFSEGRPLPAGTLTMWRYTPGDTNVYEVRGTTGPRRVAFVVGQWHNIPADSAATGLEGRPTRRLCRPASAR